MPRPRRSLDRVVQPSPAAASSGVVPSFGDSHGSAPQAARERMISVSAYLAASQNGVAPASVPDNP